jgi:hypothetical protein
MTRKITLPKSFKIKDGKISKAEYGSVAQKIRQRKSKKIKVATRVQKP